MFILFPNFLIWEQTGEGVNDAPALISVSLCKGKCISDEQVQPPIL
jgi:hypothetical protein